VKFLPRLLKRAIRVGRLRVTGPAGEVHTFGEGGDAPEVAIRISDPSFDWRIFLNPELNAGEAYMDGALTFEQGDVYDLLTLFYRNRRRFDLTPKQIFWKRLARRGKRMVMGATPEAAKRNASHHYDIGNDLYRLMLDRDMQYSCGYWPEGVATLEDAQTAKKRRIAAKLALEPGQRVLDIGCGWGGMALYLAAAADVEVVGVTLAEEQLAVARARAEAAGLADRVRFELMDYRAVTETFDRVVSVGMLEHVGSAKLGAYFLAVRDRLGPDGVALIHAITTKAPPGGTSPFLRKYIFPGGYAPAMSETLAAIEHGGLWTLDVEIWRLHYAYTIREWRERFAAVRDDLPERYDERFKRMWEFYLAAVEGVFRFSTSSVMQLQLGRELDSVPVTRGYIAEAEARYAAREPDFLPGLLASTDRSRAASAAES
jgi:cyclopropane-fatty-acyl-phospholipid synthase